MTEPVMEPVYVPLDQAGGLAEPAMEASAAATPARSAFPTMRPKARPAWFEHCAPGDDGIGGTGCRID